jgi:hypothetical protein
MIALARMRLSGFIRGGRALAPAITVLVVLGVIYGGGAAPAAVAYGYSAAALFPILAWITKLLLDAEPDVQRRLARVSIGPAREGAAGLLAALAVCLLVCALAMGAPWLFNGIDTRKFLAGGVVLGVLAHLLAIPPAVALGALASRAVTRTIRTGLAVLAVAAVLVVVLGLKGSRAPWIVPPVMATARALNDSDAPPYSGMPPSHILVLLVVRAALWTAAALAGYVALRRARS